MAFSPTRSVEGAADFLNAPWGVIWVPKRFAWQKIVLVLQGLFMARSSTSYRPKWKPGSTTVIRVPQALATAILRYAHDLDGKSKPPGLSELAAACPTAADFEAENPVSAAAGSQGPFSCRNPLTSIRAQKTKLQCDLRATFAAAFKSWRLRENIAPKQLAADLGLAVATISLWELGKRFPTGRHLEMLLDYTGLPPCRLFCVMADKCVPAECLLAMPKKP